MDVYVVFVVLALCLLWVGRELLRDLREPRPDPAAVWRRLAARFGGTYEPESRSIRCSILGRKTLIRLFHSDQHSPSGVLVETDMRGCSPGTLFIHPDYVSAKLARLVGGGEDVPTGDDAFDGDFLVRANPRDLGRQVFATSRGERLRGLIRKLSALRGPRIDLTREQLSIRLLGHLDKPESLLNLVALGNELVGAILNVRGNVDVLWKGVVETDGGRCLICGGAMDGDVIRCTACRTRHHRECWEYLGYCSLFGCLGKTGTPAGLE